MLGAKKWSQVCITIGFRGFWMREENSLALGLFSLLGFWLENGVGEPLLFILCWGLKSATRDVPLVLVGDS